MTDKFLWEIGVFMLFGGVGYLLFVSIYADWSTRRSTNDMLDTLAYLCRKDKEDRKDKKEI